MTLRTYIRLLHPIPAILWTALYTNGAAGFGVLFFGLTAPEARLLSLVVALPLLVGWALAAAAHTPMHRPFFPLLPDGTRHLQRASLWAGLVCAIGITGAVAWLRPDAPSLAVFGLAAALQALPFLNRRHLLTKIRGIKITLNLAGLQYSLMGFIVWCLVMWSCGHRLLPAMQAAPWLFFLGGLGAAYALLRVGFSPDAAHERSETPFTSNNALWGILLNGKVMARSRDEVSRYLVRQGPDAVRLQSAQGRDWPITSVGPRTWDWLQVLWHGTFGVMRRGSFLRAQQLLFIVIFGYALLIPAVLGWLFRPIIEHRPFGLSGFFESLSVISAMEIHHGLPPSEAAGRFIGILLGVVFAFCISLISIRPQQAYPVSRQRLGRVAFTHSLIQFTFALLIPTTALALASLIGQLGTGHYRTGFGLPVQAQIDFLIMPAMLLGMLAGRFIHPLARWGTILAAGTALVSLPLTHSFWPDALLGLSGVAVILCASATILWLLWIQTHRYYRACDLVAEAALAKPFAFSLTFTRHKPAPAQG